MDTAVTAPVGAAASAASVAPSSLAAHSLDMFASRRLRRIVARGPRCPDCAGPLVFGEGCQVCPVCGFSACERPSV